MSRLAVLALRILLVLLALGMLVAQLIPIPVGAVEFGGTFGSRAVGVFYAIAAIGLNILTGYCGQVSLGTGGFMAVGAYAVYKLMTAFPDVSILIHVLLAGGITAAVGVLFGLPSLRIKGFYLAVATLAAQFFLVWLFNKVPWFYNYSASGQISRASERSRLQSSCRDTPGCEASMRHSWCSPDRDGLETTVLPVRADTRLAQLSATLRTSLSRKEEDDEDD